jgi:hypothetical protein
MARPTQAQRASYTGSNHNDSGMNSDNDSLPTEEGT